MFLLRLEIGTILPPPFGLTEPIFLCSSLLLLLNLYYYFIIQGESDEKSKTSPWTCIAKYKLMVEEELAKLEG